MDWRRWSVALDSSVMRFFSCLLVLIGACGDDTSSSLGEDVVEADLQMPDDASEDSRAGDAGGDRCPTHIEMYNVANPSHSDLGWTGFGHGLGSNDGSLTTLEVTGCDSECRRCSFSGPVRSPVAINNQRRLGISHSAIGGRNVGAKRGCGPG